MVGVFVTVGLPVGVLVGVRVTTMGVAVFVTVGGTLVMGGCAPRPPKNILLPLELRSVPWRLVRFVLSSYAPMPVNKYANASQIKITIRVVMFLSFIILFMSLLMVCMNHQQ